MKTIYLLKPCTLKQFAFINSHKKTTYLYIFFVCFCGLRMQKS